MPKLDKRLRTVADQIRSRIHADIGSDHGYLLKALLSAGHIERGIAIENKPAPLKNSRATLAGLNADVRLADGLNGLQQGEADSLTLCGMGGELICRILREHPDRVPDHVVLQPNNHHDIVRRWGMDNGFHLIDELLIHKRMTYVTLVFRRSRDRRDPAYRETELIDALFFGPQLIRRRDPSLRQFLQREHRRLRQYERHNPATSQRFESVCRLLEHFDSKE